MAIEGGCRCGAVRYVLAMQPTHAMVCHCRTCQLVSGAPVMAWVSVDAGAFRFSKGAPKHYSSSAQVERRFCGDCGAQLTYRHADSPDEIDVAMATLDEPNAFAPTHHSWLSDNIGWVKFGDALPHYPRSQGSS